jgi:hypothetical protein
VIRFDRWQNRENDLVHTINCPDPSRSPRASFQAGDCSRNNFCSTKHPGDIPYWHQSIESSLILLSVPKVFGWSPSKQIVD